MKNAFRNFTRQVGLAICKTAAKSDIEEFAKLLRPVPVQHNLVRIGGDGDGGYLVPEDLNGITACFSPGIGDCTEFEQQLHKDYGITSFLIDPIYQEEHGPGLNYTTGLIEPAEKPGSSTLSGWISETLEEQPGDLMLQMDIEGAEMGVLTETTDSILRRFRIMVIEFHDMERVFSRESLPFLTGLFAKIRRNFIPVHIHPNNAGGVARYGPLKIPRLLEITFLRRDRLGKNSPLGQVTLPHKLDRPNIPDKPDIKLPEYWWYR